MVCVFCGPSSLFAGGGPENVLLVVNQRSGGSKAIANHYRHLRKIPDANTLYLDWAGGIETTTIDEFRDKILRPIFATIEKRKMTAQIDYVVYSSDFPYAINFGNEVPSSPPGKFTVGSLTGLTYLAPLVMAKTSYSGERMNWYVRNVTPSGIQTAPTRGFRFEYFWNNQGELTGADGMRYMLSAMLGYTAGRGNSIEEVFNYLDRSVSADHSRPEGTIYYCQNDDVRSKTRDSWFSLAVRELRELGVQAQILQGNEGVIPKRRKDVLGAMMGKANLGWSASANEIVPGAFCENFTSYGGVLSDGTHQTPLTELMRYGAAGSTGTVVEPYAKPDKFPNAFVQVHYARGCSLAEAVYQSVRGPYQLLLVGDPLCQPWAKPPQVEVDEIKKDGTTTITGALTLTPKSIGDVPAKRIDVFLEGRRVGQVAPGESYVLDTTQIPDGYHEIRLVAIADNLIETQGREILSFVSKNHDKEITFRAIPNDEVAWSKPLIVDAESPEAKGIAIYSGRQILARSPGDKCRMIVNSSKLGLGNVSLQVIGLHDIQVAQNVFSRPVRLNVVPRKPFPPLPPPVGFKYEPGLRLSNVLATTVLKDSSARDWPKKSGLQPGEQFSLEGLVRVPVDGIYQVQTQVSGDIKVWIGKKVVANLKNEKGNLAYRLVPLQKGWHALRAEAKLDGRLLCYLKFGGRGCHTVGAPAFHVPP